MPPLDPEKVRAGFANKKLAVINNKEELMEWMSKQSFKNANLLLMSSGNYDGADILTFAKDIVKKK